MDRFHGNPGWILLLPALLSACALSKTAATPPQPEPDFGFVFEHGACYRDVLDTFKGAFTKDLIYDPAVTVPFRLSQSELESVYQKMVKIDFFHYPEIFAISQPPDTIVAMVSPYERYKINVINGGTSKTVSWEDMIKDPNPEKADNLRSLFAMIIAMIEENPEYQKLPERRGACL